MKVRCPPAGQIVVSAVTLMLLAGCAATPMGPTVQVMPGPGKSFDAFAADQAFCKSYAADQVKGQAEAANKNAVGVAVLTTALSAGVGAANGNLAGNTSGGAAAGGAAGAANSAVAGAMNTSTAAQAGIQQQYDGAFAQCMYAKGEQVPGMAPVATSAPPPPPAPVAAVPDPQVRSIQSELIRLGYLKGQADGFIGPKTRGAISGFQQANGLPVSGSPSSRLLAKLQATPTAAAATTATAPSGWVAPVGSTPPTAATPVSATAPAGWVQPTQTP